MSSKCDLQGSQGKPIALGANSNARTHQPSVQIQDRQRIESPTMFIGAVAICDNQAWFELKGNNKEFDNKVRSFVLSYNKASEIT